MDFEEEEEIVAYIVLEEMYNEMMLMLSMLMVMMYATLHRHYQNLRDRSFVRHETRADGLDRLICGSYEAWTRIRRHGHDTTPKAPEAKGYRNKPVPNFDRHAFIFGNDRATGEGAKGPAGPADAVENLEAEGNNEIRVDEMNTSTSVTQAAKSQPPSRKRVRSTDSLAISMKEMRSMIELYVGSMDKRMGDVAERLGQAKDLSKDRRRIIEELQKMTTLTTRDQIVVARKIGERSDYVDLFFSANDEYKQEFVAMLLVEGC